jgi:hypothetical protein
MEKEKFEVTSCGDSGQYGIIIWFGQKKVDMKFQKKLQCLIDILKPFDFRGSLYGLQKQKRNESRKMGTLQKISSGAKKKASRKGART